ncbi:hypothetical protein BT63DRAFT_437729 [Microthyrium microscopicum]|uniref:Uncharacterized protein n=1 Tax=Microthyrium microscopicum TaxID=703497 RepID=A0A6A6ULK4_9PEZI|nr:hypothetical protein BT63DRAFT_437729 [Microthyrium microscopicum]
MSLEVMFLRSTSNTYTTSNPRNHSIAFLQQATSYKFFAQPPYCTISMTQHPEVPRISLFDSRRSESKRQRFPPPKRPLRPKALPPLKVLNPKTQKFGCYICYCWGDELQHDEIRCPRIKYDKVKLSQDCKACLELHKLAVQKAAQQDSLAVRPELYAEEHALIDCPGLRTVKDELLFLKSVYDDNQKIANGSRSSNSEIKAHRTRVLKDINSAPNTVGSTANQLTSPLRKDTNHARWANASIRLAMTRDYSNVDSAATDCKSFLQAQFRIMHIFGTNAQDLSFVKPSNCPQLLWDWFKDETPEDAEKWAPGWYNEGPQHYWFKRWQKGELTRRELYGKTRVGFDTTPPKVKEFWWGDKPNDISNKQEPEKPKPKSAPSVQQTVTFANFDQKLDFLTPYLGMCSPLKFGSMDMDKMDIDDAI